MALYKQHELDSGVVVSYHRIPNINVLINGVNLITVCSYTSEQKREEEKNNTPGETMDIFTEGKLYEAPYQDGMTAQQAYEWLKENVDWLADAEDV